jgi:hypothetical protein
MDIFEIDLLLLEFLSSINFWEFFEKKNTVKGNSYSNIFIDKMQQIFFEKHTFNDTYVAF